MDIKLCFDAISYLVIVLYFPFNDYFNLKKPV